MTAAAAQAAALFGRSWIFLRGITRLEDLPPAGPPEIAFAGRSNVGKSSLINAVTGQKGLARTSNTPGRTQELNLFIPEENQRRGDADIPQAVIVDMPGYGYAAAPKAKVDQWTRLVFEYLRGRPTLKRVFLLVDSRHGLRDRDLEVLKLLDRAAVSYQLVLTKADKPKSADVVRVLEETRTQVAKRPAAFPEIIVTSSSTNTGIEVLREAILAAVSS